MRMELSSKRGPLLEGKKMYFSGRLLVEITIEQTKRRQFIWLVKILLNAFSMGTIRLGMGVLKTQNRKKFYHEKHITLRVRKKV